MSRQAGSTGDAKTLMRTDGILTRDRYRNSTRVIAAIGVALHLAIAVQAFAQLGPTTVTFVFTGSGAALGQVVSEAIPVELGGGALACGRPEGTPACSIADGKQCCVRELDDRLLGTGFKLFAPSSRGHEGGSPIRFSGWGGACAPLEPLACDEVTFAFEPHVCNGRLDTRGTVEFGSGRGDRFATFGCDLVLPEARGENVTVTLKWSRAPGDSVPYPPVCAPGTSGTTGDCQNNCGDANGDGQVNVTDALFVLISSVGAQPCDPCICDVFGVGGPLVGSALAILLNSVGLTNTPLACGFCGVGG